MVAAEDAGQGGASSGKPKTKTPGETRAHKRQLEQLNEDARLLCNLDIHTPFRSMQDAVERLLPFHLLGSLEPDAADMEEMYGMDSAELLFSRSHLADLQAMHNAVEALRKLDAVRQRLDTANHRYCAPPAQQLLPEDRVIVARIMLQEAREQLERERRRPPGFMTPERDEQQVEGAGTEAGAALGEVAGEGEAGAVEGEAGEAAGLLEGGEAADQDMAAAGVEGEEEEEEEEEEEGAGEGREGTSEVPEEELAGEGEEEEGEEVGEGEGEGEEAGADMELQGGEEEVGEGEVGIVGEGEDDDDDGEPSMDAPMEGEDYGEISLSDEPDAGLQGEGEEGQEEEEEEGVTPAATQGTEGDVDMEAGDNEGEEVEGDEGEEG